MSTEPMMSSIAEKIDRIPDKYEVHTVLIVLNGQHGNFDVRVEATDDNLEDHAWVGVVDRHGGVSPWRKQPAEFAASKRVSIAS